VTRFRKVSARVPHHFEADGQERTVHRIILEDLGKVLSAQPLLLALQDDPERFEVLGRGGEGSVSTSQQHQLPKKKSNKKKEHITAAPAS